MQPLPEKKVDELKTFILHFIISFQTFFIYLFTDYLIFRSIIRFFLLS